MGRRSLYEDLRIYGPPEYRAWGYRLACVKVGCTTTAGPPGRRRVIECCHTETDGTGRKADWRGKTFFACWRCHREQGDHGLWTFARRHPLAVDGHPVPSLYGAARLALKLFLLYDGGLAE